MAESYALVTTLTQCRINELVRHMEIKTRYVQINKALFSPCNSNKPAVLMEPVKYSI